MLPLLSLFNAFFSWCVRDERISVNPCEGIRRTARKGRKGPNTRRGMRALYNDEPIRIIRAAEPGNGNRDDDREETTGEGAEILDFERPDDNGNPDDGGEP